MKKCGKCKIEKEIKEFSNSQFQKSGGVCRRCNTEIMKKYRAHNPEKIKKYQKEYDKKYYQMKKQKLLNNKITNQPIEN